MATRTAKEARGEPNAPWYVKLFVIFHVFAVLVWALPHPPERLLTGAKPPAFDVGSKIRVWNAEHLQNNPYIDAYLFTTGFWQYWDMFAPNPAQTDFWADADVIYRDGSKRHYQYPRMFKLPLTNKYAQERYRKFFERANSEGFSHLWPQFALRIAYLNDDPKNPPVTVRLTRHWLPIAPPGKPQQQEYNSYMYFEYAVDQAALQRMREGRA